MSAASGRQPFLVMVVDNDYHHLLYTTYLLQRFEYGVCTAGSAEEAVEMAFRTVPAIILTELDLPQMSGLDLLNRLRSEPGTAGVPVVALTRNADNATEAGRMSEGFGAALRKPVCAEELFRTVQAAVEPTPRRNLRIRVKLPVTVNNVPLDCAKGECASVISAQGLYISTHRPHPPRSRITVQITVNGQTILADCVVLYSRRLGEGLSGERGMGVKFVHIEPKDQEHLRTFINTKVSGNTVLLAP